MEFIEFIQKFFVFLLPGILGLIVFNYFNPCKQKHYYIEFLYIILYSFFSFLIVDSIFALIKRCIPSVPFYPINIVTHIGTLNGEMPLVNMIAAIIVVMIIALTGTKINYRNTLFKMANKLKITYRTNNTTVWENALHDKTYVVIRDYITKNTYYGQLLEFSDASDLRELRLGSVSAFNEESELLYEVNEVFISRGHNEFSIETYNYEENPIKKEGENDIKAIKDSLVKKINESKMPIINKKDQVSLKSKNINILWTNMKPDYVPPASKKKKGE
jgi:hypothetical protein